MSSDKKPVWEQCVDDINKALIEELKEELERLRKLGEIRPCLPPEYAPYVYPVTAPECGGWCVDWHRRQILKEAKQNERKGND